MQSSWVMQFESKYTVGKSRKGRLRDTPTVTSAVTRRKVHLAVLRPSDMVVVVFGLCGGQVVSKFARLLAKDCQSQWRDIFRERGLYS